MARKWNLKRFLRELKEWLSRPDNINRFRDQVRIDIERAIVLEPTSADLRVFQGRLDRVALWEAIYGTVLVLDGNQAGWSHIYTSVRYSGWKVRLLVGLCERNEDAASRLALNHACRCLAGSIALRHDAFAHWCGLRLINCIELGNDVFPKWDLTPFEPFMVKLYALWRGRELDVRRPHICPLGVYQQVFDTWESEASFTNALRAICNYHCDRTDQRGDNEFMWSPYDVFPAEILALRRIRRELGLSRVTIEHPLLDNPLAHPPDEIVAVPDELMHRALVWVHSKIPWEEEP
jgi:hypothetical protein